MIILLSFLLGFFTKAFADILQIYSNSIDSNIICVTQIVTWVTDRTKMIVMFYFGFIV